VGSCALLCVIWHSHNEFICNKVSFSSFIRAIHFPKSLCILGATVWQWWHRNWTTSTADSLIQDILMPRHCMFRGFLGLVRHTCFCLVWSVFTQPNPIIHLKTLQVMFGRPGLSGMSPIIPSKTRWVKVD
jgi:hypothetical protein